MDGKTWHASGVDSEIAPLRQVLLSWPGEEQNYKDNPNDWLMMRRPQLDRLQDQCRALVDVYERLGVQVHLDRPERVPRPNHIFQRDLFFMTPEGAVIARPAAQQRAGEERQAAAALARLGVPILMTFRGHATFEGADALWLDPQTVLIGVGLRTNQEAQVRLAPLLEDLGVQSIGVPMPTTGIQHLLGIINPIDRNLVALRRRHIHPLLLDRLARQEIETIDLPEDEEITERGGMNFVALGPRKLLMPSNCPRTRTRYEEAGVTVHEADVSEYLAAAGGIGCLTGIVARDPERDRSGVPRPEDS